MAAAHPAGLSADGNRASAPAAAPDRAVPALMVLLFGGVLTLWVPNRWPIGIFQAGIYALTILVIVRSLWLKSAVRARPILIPLAGVLALGICQMEARRTSYMAATRESVLGWAANVCLVFVAVQLFRQRDVGLRFLRILFYFGFFISTVAVTQVWTSAGAVFWLFPSGYSDLVLGPFVSRNLYSAFIELLLPIGLWDALSGSRRGLHATMCGVMAASVAAGASRAGAVLTVAEVAAVLILARIRLRQGAQNLARAAVALGVACAACVAVFGGTAAWHRLREPDPYAGRREMLLSSLAMVRERPWTGFGMGAWSVHYPRFAYYDDGTVTAHAHNDWAEWAVEGGLPLLAMMAAIAALTLRRGMRSAAGIGIAALWVHCSVDSPLHNPVLAGWFFVIAGVLAAADGVGDARRGLSVK